MFAEQIRAALQGTPRGRLTELAAAVWKGFACGAIGETDAQQLADEIHARKAIPPTPAAPRKPVGSRPRSPAHMERRRRWTGSGWLPPQLACRFTMAETAVLSTIAAEVARRGLCRLTIGHIAALAGVSRSTVKSAVREAVALGILTSEEWRLTAWRSAPNTVRIVSAEWRTWLKMRDRKRAGADHPRHAEDHAQRGGVRTSTTLWITDSSQTISVRQTAHALNSEGRKSASSGLFGVSKPPHGAGMDLSVTFGS